MPPARSRSSITRPAVRFRMRIISGDVVAVGPGKINLLEAIEKTGSLAAEARSIDMSYRRAWVLVNELNASLKNPAVESMKGGERGGGSKVTSVGHQLIKRYRTIEMTATLTCQTEIRALTKLLVRSAA